MLYEFRIEASANYLIHDKTLKDIVYALNTLYLCYIYD